jgi:hypothetical protein
MTSTSPALADPALAEVQERRRGRAFHTRAGSGPPQAARPPDPTQIAAESLPG